MIDKRQFASEMVRLGVVYSRSVDKAVIAAYYEALGGLTDSEFTSAVRDAVRSERFFPTPAVLLDYADTSGPKMLLSPARTEAEREHDREIARKGVEMCRKAFEARYGPQS